MFFYLICHDGDERLLPGCVVRPIADDLEAVGQVAVGVGEVGLELERGAVALDGLGDVARVLVHRGQVGVGVGEGGVDLWEILKKTTEMSVPENTFKSGEKINSCSNQKSFLPMAS